MFKTAFNGYSVSPLSFLSAPVPSSCFFAKICCLSETCEPAFEELSVDAIEVRNRFHDFWRFCEELIEED